MKKTICLLLSLLLCLTSVVAFAEAVEPAEEIAPSKTVQDLTLIEIVKVANPPADGFYIKIVDPSEVKEQEMEKLNQVETEEYFADLKNNAGAPAALAEYVGSGDLTLAAFSAVTAGGYDAAYGDVTVRLLFPIVYEDGQKVAVLIGIVTENNVAWTVFEGVSVGSETVEAQGTIEAVLTPEIVLAIQDGTALLAVVG